jgi:hypothetical protein
VPIAGGRIGNQKPNIGIQQHADGVGGGISGLIWIRRKKGKVRNEEEFTSQYYNNNQPPHIHSRSNLHTFSMRRISWRQSLPQSMRKGKGANGRAENNKEQKRGFLTDLDIFYLFC